jgi:hypothetical protein
MAGAEGMNPARQPEMEIAKRREKALTKIKAC